METQQDITSYKDISSKFDPILTSIKIKNIDEDENVQELYDVSFLLSFFDNIVGPNILHVWTYDVYSKMNLKPKSHLNDYLLEYISIHTLNGELYQDKLLGQIKYRLYFIKEVNSAIYSVFFDAKTADMNCLGSTNGNMTTTDSQDMISLKKKSENYPTLNNCLSLIFPLDKKDMFFKSTLLNSRVFLNFFENVVLEYKALAHIGPKIGKASLAIDYLTKSIQNFGNMVKILNQNGILKTKMFSDEGFDYQNKIQIDDTFLNDVYMLPSIHSMITNEFVLKSITSHLITNFYTIIVGKSSSLVNKMINTLALFMQKEKIQLSCYAVSDYLMLSPYIILQGLVIESPENFNAILESDFLFKRDYPTTIIDISNKTVCRTCIGKEFIHTKEKFINQKIKYIFNNMSLSEIKTLSPADDYLSWISYSSNENQPKLIKQMLQEIELFESEFGIKQSFIEKKIKDFNFMALSLIEYINCKLLESSCETSKPLNISRKVLIKILDLSTEEDLNIVLAFANNLKPDFFQSIIFKY